jgi:hypothetical protein
MGIYEIEEISDKRAEKISAFMASVDAKVHYIDKFADQITKEAKLKLAHYIITKLGRQVVKRKFIGTSVTADAVMFLDITSAADDPAFVDGAYKIVEASINELNRPVTEQSR